MTFLCLSIQSSSAAGDSSFVVFRDVNAGWNDMLHLGNRVGSLSSSSAQSLALGCGAVIAGDAILMCSGADQRFREAMTGGHTAQKDKFADFGNTYGTTGVALGICGSLYVGGLIASSDELRTTSRLTIESLIIGGVCTTVLKVAVGRSRPYTGNGVTFFRPFAFKEESFSWPSGHSTVAFCVSSTLAQRCHNIFASIGLYAIAGATASARMYYDKHWLSDVLTGAAIGIASSSLAVSLNAESETPTTPSHSQLFVMPTSNGISLAYSW